MSKHRKHTRTDPLILAINPGSTTTKTALFKGNGLLFNEKTAHSLQTLSTFKTIPAQAGLRIRAVAAALKKNILTPGDVDAVVARGGLLRPCPCGVYKINSAMLDDLEKSRFGEHASNLGAIIAHHIASQSRIPAFVVNPPVVDELCREARLSGLPGIKRRAVWHALNQKMVGKIIADRLHFPYEKLNLIIAHLGGGISIAAHRHGRAIDVNNALEGEGPFSVERSGGIAAADIARLAQTTALKDILSRIAGYGGIAGYLGTNDFLSVERRLRNGDTKAAAVVAAMAYQTAKEIAARAAVLCGEVDAIVLTGSVVYSKTFVSRIKRRIRFIAPVHVVPGEMEMQALAEGAMNVLAGSEQAHTYPSRKTQHKGDPLW